LADRTDCEGIEIHRGCPVKHIDPRQPSVRGATAFARSVPYDQLVIATGAAPVHAEFEGRDLPGVYELHTMEDSFKVKKHLQQLGVKSAIIAGSGYIGVDPEFGALIEDTGGTVLNSSTKPRSRKSNRNLPVCL
jgi:NAD(P)H-nitrite reductase large subunit